MRSVGAVCCVYDDDQWLPCVIEGCYDVVDRLFFLVGHAPWNGERAHVHSTPTVIRTFPDPFGKITIVEGEWRNEADQRNAGLALCKDAGLTYCLVVDADEVYDPATLASLIDVAQAHPHVGAWTIPLVTYWKSYLFCIEPPERLCPVMLVRPGSGEFTKNREFRTPLAERFPRELGVCHHLSYSRTDDQVQQKISRFSHAHQILPGWFERIWLAWDRNHDLEDLHPTVPACYKRAVRQDPRRYPPVLQKRYQLEYPSDDDRSFGRTSM